jgi:hypothetical protein
MKAKKLLKRITIFAICAVVVIIFIKCLNIYKYRTLKNDTTQNSLFSDYHDYGGIIHCHSIYSDGSGTVEEIMAAANESGAKYLILTDHNTRQAIKDGKEGWYDNCLLLIGEEISLFEGHYVALDIPPAAFKFSPQAQPTIDDVTELGGFGIIAHPFTPYKHYWHDWSVDRFQGMELINIDSQWRDERLYKLLWLLFAYKLNPIYALLSTFDYPAPNITKWDQLTQTKPIIGIAGNDAHQNIALFAGLNLEFPSYKNIFTLAQVHIITSKPFNKEKDTDKALVYHALRKGNCYLSLEALAESRGFLFNAECQGNKAIMGDTLLFHNYANLTVAHSFPAEAQIVLIKDGKRIVESSDKLLQYRVHEAGVYRVEIWPEKRYFPKGTHVPWIISNPIYLREKAYFEQEKKQKADKSTIKISPSCIQLLEDFEGLPATSTFQFEYDSKSFIDEKTTIEMKTPIEESEKALKMNFHLGKIDKNHREVWCAFGERKKRNLSNYNGISFYIKGDKIYRIGFQLRESDAGGGEERIEEWETTIKVRPPWEKKTIYFKDLYLLSKTTNGKRELDRVKGLFFIINQRNTHPATKGTIWLDHICLF